MLSIIHVQLAITFFTPPPLLNFYFYWSLQTCTLIIHERVLCFPLSSPPIHFHVIHLSSYVYTSGILIFVAIQCARYSRSIFFFSADIFASNRSLRTLRKKIFVFRVSNVNSGFHQSTWRK